MVKPDFLYAIMFYKGGIADDIISQKNVVDFFILWWYNMDKTITCKYICVERSGLF